MKIGSRTPPEYVTHLDPSTLNGPKLNVSHSGFWEHTLAQFSAVSLDSSAKLLPSTNSSALLSVSLVMSEASSGPE